MLPVLFKRKLDLHQTTFAMGEAVAHLHTLWHAGLSYRQRVDVGSVHWFARLENAGNALAYSASSVLTSTVPGRVPLPGRSLKLGAQWQF